MLSLVKRIVLASKVFVVLPFVLTSANFQVCMKKSLVSSVLDANCAFAADTVSINNMESNHFILKC